MLLHYPLRVHWVCNWCSAPNHFVSLLLYPLQEEGSRDLRAAAGSSSMTRASGSGAMPGRSLSGAGATSAKW